MGKWRLIGLAFLLSATLPTAVRAQAGSPSPRYLTTSDEGVEPTPEILVWLICRANDLERLLPALRRFEELARDDPETHLDLAACLNAPSGSPRPGLIIATLENLARGDLIRDSLPLIRDPRDRFRARVALANLHGSYRDLALALGRAEDQGVSNIDARLSMSYLRPPREVPRNVFDQRALSWVLDWCQRNVVQLPRGWAEWLRHNLVLSSTQ